VVNPPTPLMSSGIYSLSIRLMHWPPLSRKYQTKLKLYHNSGSKHATATFNITEILAYISQYLV